MASSNGNPMATPAPRRKVRRDSGLSFTPMAAPLLLAISMRERITHYDGFQQARSAMFSLLQRLHAVGNDAQVHPIDLPTQGIAQHLAREIANEVRPAFVQE